MKHQQAPLMEAHAGGVGSDARMWAASAQVELADIIDGYLDGNPPPAPTEEEAALRAWSQGLRACGSARLAALELEALPRVV